MFSYAAGGAEESSRLLFYGGGWRRKKKEEASCSSFDEEEEEEEEEGCKGGAGEELLVGGRAAAHLMALDEARKWVSPVWQPVEARHRLFCIHGSGCTGNVFANFTNLEACMEVWAVCLPGRLHRLDEELPLSVEDIAAQIATALHVLDWVSPTSEFYKPFSIYGQELGGLVAFELCHALLRDAVPGGGASLLVVSSICPPRSVRSRTKLSEWDREAREAEISKRFCLRLSSNLLHLFESSLLQDLRVLDSYSYRPSSTLLRCPILCVGGSEDEELFDLNGWHMETVKSCDVFMLPGGASFLCSEKNIARLLQSISLHVGAIMAEIDSEGG
jgi:surfactin synthase thioesterase subunit